MSDEIILRQVTEEQQKQIATMGLYITQMTGMMAEMERRMQALEKLGAERVSITHKQAKALQAQIKERAEALCEKYDFDPKADGAKFRRAITKAVLKTYAVEDLHDLPVSCFAGAGAYIGNWNSFAFVRKLRNED